MAWLKNTVFILFVNPAIFIFIKPLIAAMKLCYISGEYSNYFCLTGSLVFTKTPIGESQ